MGRRDGKPGPRPRPRSGRTLRIGRHFPQQRRARRGARGRARAQTRQCAQRGYPGGLPVHGRHAQQDPQQRCLQRAWGRSVLVLPNRGGRHRTGIDGPARTPPAPTDRGRKERIGAGEAQAGSANGPCAGQCARHRHAARPDHAAQLSATANRTAP